MSKKEKPTMYILYPLFLDEKGEEFIIGGIQQYILGLINTFKNDFTIVIVQKAKFNFCKKFDDYIVKGSFLSKKNIGKELYKTIAKNIKKDDFIIWATDRISIKTKQINTISIQHGITFDFIDYNNIKFGRLLKKSLTLSILYRILQQYSAIKFFLRTPKVVCVDYNFLNWARIILPRNITDRAIVIPNFSKLPDKSKRLDKEKKDIKILFARRFVEYRGVFILSEIIEHFLKNNSNVYFGIYGEGPLESFLKEKFDKFENIKISSYKAEDSQKIQLEYDISLIPTYGSEGTSLSLLESMSCGCVPIASNIGGMTNVVIDRYNGFLVDPIAADFIDKIEYLIDNPNEINRISEAARNSIEYGFLFHQWQERWKKIIKNS